MPDLEKKIDDLIGDIHKWELSSTKETAAIESLGKENRKDVDLLFDRHREHVEIQGSIRDKVFDNHQSIKSVAESVGDLSSTVGTLSNTVEALDKKVTNSSNRGKGMKSMAVGSLKFIGLVCSVAIVIITWMTYSKEVEQLNLKITAAEKYVEGNHAQKPR